MRIFYSEYNKNYASYTFGYSVYAELADDDVLTSAYEAGFLPFTGDYAINPQNQAGEIYYLARSLRISRNAFKLSSENRRTLKKGDELNIKMLIHEKSELIDDEFFREFCLSYTASRFSTGEMSLERWNHILNRKCATHVITFSSNENQIGYVLIGMDDRSLHYWFSFFDINYLGQFPIGKYFMTAAVRWAFEHGKDHVYLGTCYNERSLYKVRDFKGVSFFDGEHWNSDINTLKAWCKSDDDVMTADRLKQ